MRQQMNSPYKTHDKTSGHMKRAANAYRRGDLGATIEQCLQILSMDAQNADAHYLLGLALYRDNKLQTAITHLKTAAILNSSDASIFCNLGLAYSADGNHADAVKAYRQSLRLNPDLVDANYQLAIAYKIMGNISEASKQYRVLIEKSPDYMPAYNNLGNLLADNGRPDEAIRVLQQACASPQADHIVFYNLANVFHTERRHEEAIEYYRESIRRQKDFSQAYLNIAHIHELENRPDKELAVYRHLEEVCPDLPELHDRLGSVFTRQGEYSAAISAYDKALSLAPGSINTICSKAEVLERNREYDGARTLINDILSQNSKHAYANFVSGKLYYHENCFDKGINAFTTAIEHTDNSKILAESHMLLGHLYSRIHEYKASYEHIRIGNRIVAENTVNLEELKARFVAEIDHGKFHLDAFAKVSSGNSNSCGSSPGDELAFIVGFPRSGTTLLDVILESHPKIQTVEEKPVTHEMYRHYITACNNGTYNPESLTKDNISELQDVYYDHLSRYADRDASGYIVDKFPLNIARAHLLWRVFPSARFILALRHPCDACMSCLMQNFSMNSAMSNFLDISDTTRLYTRIMDRWLQLTELLPIQHHAVTYEMLVSDFDNEVGRLLDFLELDWDENLHHYQSPSNLRKTIKTPSYKQVRQPLYKHAISRWTNYRQFVGDEFDKLEPYATRFGYPPFS